MNRPVWLQRFGGWAVTTSGIWSLMISVFLTLVIGLIVIWTDTQSYRATPGQPVEKWVDFNMEMFKTGLQLIAVVILGGAAKLLFDRHQEHREKRETRREAQRKFLDALVLAYQQTKQNRRLLRARAFRHSGTDIWVRPKPYDDLMMAISQCQLALEALLRQIESSSHDRFPERKNLLLQIRRMETYLGGVVTEWGQVMPYLRTPGAQMACGSMQACQDFVGPSSGSNFEKDFVVPYKKVHARISRAIQAGNAGHALARPRRTPAIPAGSR